MKCNIPLICYRKNAEFSHEKKCKNSTKKTKICENCANTIKLLMLSIYFHVKSFILRAINCCNCNIIVLCDIFPEKFCFLSQNSFLRKDYQWKFSPSFSSAENPNPKVANSSIKIYDNLANYFFKLLKKLKPSTIFLKWRLMLQKSISELDKSNLRPRRGDTFKLTLSWKLIQLFIEVWIYEVKRKPFSKKVLQI